MTTQPPSPTLLLRCRCIISSCLLRFRCNANKLSWKEKDYFKNYSIIHSWHCIFTVSSFLFEFVCLQYRRQQLIQEFSLQATSNSKMESLPWEVKSCQLVKNLSAFHETQEVITLFTTAWQWSLFWATPCVWTWRVRNERKLSLICSMFHALIRRIKFIRRPKNALVGGPYVIKLHSQIQVHLLVFLINFTKESSFKSNSIMKFLIQEEQIFSPENGMERLKKKDSFIVAIQELNLHVMQHTECILFKCATQDIFFHSVHKTWILYLVL